MHSRIHANLLPRTYLHLNFPNMQHIDFCISDAENNNFSCKRTGTYYSFYSRDMPYPQFIFKLPLAKNETKMVYMRFQTESSMKIALKCVAISLRVFGSASFACKSGKA
ncbi:MAG: 7TM-DISM domain-containing protein [Methylococcales bacterium]